MSRRLVLAVRRALRSQPGATETVHFHRGSQGNPEPCFDLGCSRPHLEL
jgi:hypothetical protein